MRRSKSILNYLKYIRKLDIDQLWRHIRCHLLSRLGFLQLKKIFICPSHECNANCTHCYEKFSHENFRKSLTTDQVKNIIEQFYKLGGYFVYFCSGEFLLRDDALELIRYARSKDMTISLTTNGLLLDEKKIDELNKAGLKVLIVSIDSAKASRHNELRGLQGCFEKAINGIRIAKKKMNIVWIWTYVTKTNFDELTGISKLGTELDVDLIFAFFPLLSGHLFNRYDENLTYEEKQFLRGQFNQSSNVILEFISEKDKCRGGGLEHICVMPSGDVTFCPPVPYSYGNINTKSLKDCLKEILNDYKRFFCYRGQCIVNFPEYRKNCNAEFIYQKY